VKNLQAAMKIFQAIKCRKSLHFYFYPKNTIYPKTYWSVFNSKSYLTTYFSTIQQVENIGFISFKRILKGFCQQLSSGNQQRFQQAVENEV
jgi:hypothetical protein